MCLHLNLFTYKEDIIKLSPNVTESNIKNLGSNKPALPVGNFPLGKHLFQGGGFTETPSASIFATDTVSPPVKVVFIPLFLKQCASNTTTDF